MNFKLELLKQLLTSIESKLTFSVEGVKEPQSFDIKCYIDIEELIQKYSKISSEDEVKYCLALLKQFGYINISNGFISNVTPEGLKFMAKVLHDMYNVL